MNSSHFGRGRADVMLTCGAGVCLLGLRAHQGPARGLLERPNTIYPRVLSSGASPLGLPVQARNLRWNAISGTRGASRISTLTLWCHPSQALYLLTQTHTPLWEPARHMWEHVKFLATSMPSLRDVFRRLLYRFASYWTLDIFSSNFNCGKA